MRQRDGNVQSKICDLRLRGRSAGVLLIVIQTCMTPRYNRSNSDRVLKTSRTAKQGDRCAHPCGENRCIILLCHV